MIKTWLGIKHSKNDPLGYSFAENCILGRFLSPLGVPWGPKWSPKWLKNWTNEKTNRILGPLGASGPLRGPFWLNFESILEVILGSLGTI